MSGKVRHAPRRTGKITLAFGDTAQGDAVDVTGELLKGRPGP
ncbi:hypothetical protein OG453_34450 [Streptomyces sp. NBC_01381]|nr:hypothetical protein [Streptomyces sp. NBC_01381]MCX4671731.1 hypothetical protein [Streptomyces sp. NBC_01381]